MNKGLLGGDNIYNIKKNVDRIKRGEATFFLDQKKFKLITNRLKKDEYKIYKPFTDSTKVILYTDELPEIILYEIKSKIALRHQDILGSIFALNINEEMFGDIVIDDGHYYIYILKLIDNYINANLLFIKTSPIELERRDRDYLKNFQPKYEEKEIIVSSLRIDNVIARIINSNRNSVLEKIKNKEIILNYEIVTKASYILKEQDIFSIRKFGKYKFIGIERTTKKDNYIIKYQKYL